MKENYSCCLTTAMKIHRPLVEASCDLFGICSANATGRYSLFIVYWSDTGLGHKNFMVKLQVLLNIVTPDFSLEITALGI